MTDRRVPTDKRILTDADIQAIVSAMAAHDDHCRFKTFSPEHLQKVVNFVDSISSAMEEGKSVVRKTLIVLLLGGIVTLIGLGSTAKLSQFLKP